MKQLSVFVTFLVTIILSGIAINAQSQECDSWIKGNYQPNENYKGFLCSNEGLIYEATYNYVTSSSHIVCKDDQLNILYESTIDIDNFVTMEFFSEGILVASQDNDVVLYYLSKDLKLKQKWELPYNSYTVIRLAVGSSRVFIGLSDLILCYNYQFEQQWAQTTNNFSSFLALNATADDELYYFGDESTISFERYYYGKISKTGENDIIKTFNTIYKEKKHTSYNWALIDSNGNLYLDCGGFVGFGDTLYSPLVKVKPDGTHKILIGRNYSIFSICYDRFRDKVITIYVQHDLLYPLWADVTSDGVVTNHYAYPTSGDELSYYNDFFIPTPKNLFILGWANKTYLNIQKYYDGFFAMKLTNDYCFFPKDQNYGGDNKSINCIQDVVIGLKDELAEIIKNPKKTFSELTYNWDSPNLGTGVQKTVKPNFTTEYNVTIKAKNCTINDMVKVNVSRKTDFTYSVDNYEVRVTPVHPIDYNFIWDFGNGITNQVNIYPTYTYPSSGTFSLCLADFSNTVICHSCVDIKLPGNYSGSSVLQPGIPEDTQFPIIKLFPNPVSGNTLTLDFGDYKEDWEIKIFDITGQLMHSNFYKSQSSINIDVSQFNNGLYLINFSAPGKEKSMKFVKL